MKVEQKELFGTMSLSEIDDLLDVCNDYIHKDINGRDIKVLSYSFEKEFRKYSSFYAYVLSYIEVDGGDQYQIVLNGIWDDSFGTDWEDISIEKGKLTEETKIIPEKRVLSQVWIASE
jgi:hypothetical protein